MFGTRLHELHEFVDVGTIHVKLPTSSIFLCGGDVGLPLTPINSLRKAFLRFAGEAPFQKYKILIAEKLNAFFPRGTYRDLLSLESDIAQVASLIVVFSESYGSAAELGAFAMTPDIAARLLVVIDDENYKETSFVRLGPLMSLQNNIGRSSVYVLSNDEINIKSIKDVSTISLPQFKIEMAQACSEREKSIETESTLNPRNNGHMIMLMSGLIQLHGALKIEELERCLHLLGFESQREKIENLLLCAEFMEWVKKTPRGSFDFYVSTLEKQVVTFKKSDSLSTLNPVRWRSDVLEFWKEVDPSRFSEITKARARK